MANIDKKIQIQQKKGVDIIRCYPITKWENIENIPQNLNNTTTMSNSYTSFIESVSNMNFISVF